MDLPPPGLELLAHDRKVRKPQHQTGAELLVDAEQLQFLAEHAMVAPLDLLKALQVVIELLLVGPDRAVDALQLRVALVAAPVRAGDRQKLEGTDLSCPLEVRSPAQIDEPVVLVDADLSVLDLVVAVLVRAFLCELFDLVDLVVLIPLAEELERLRDGQVAMLERQVLLGDLAHLRLDLFEVVWGQRAREIEVVVEAVGDRWSEAELRPREQLEHRAGHHVRGRMAQRVELLVAVVRLAVSLRHSATPKQKSPPSLGREVISRFHPASPATPARFILGYTGPAPSARRWSLGVRCAGLPPLPARSFAPPRSLSASSRRSNHRPPTSRDRRGLRRGSDIEDPLTRMAGRARDRSRPVLILVRVHRRLLRRSGQI